MITCVVLIHDKTIENCVQIIQSANNTLSDSLVLCHRFLLFLIAMCRSVHKHLFDEFLEALLCDAQVLVVDYRPMSNFEKKFAWKKVRLCSDPITKAKRRLHRAICWTVGRPPQSHNWQTRFSGRATTVCVFVPLDDATPVWTQEVVTARTPTVRRLNFRSRHARGLLHQSQYRQQVPINSVGNVSR